MEETLLLQKLGLSKIESSIYLALLRHGPMTISNISKESGQYRPMVYKWLAELIKKNIVTESPRGKQKIYSAESPSRLKYLLESLTEEFNKKLPELEDEHKKIGERPKVKFLTGRHGVTSVFDDIVDSLERGDIFYRYDSASDQIKSDSYVPKSYRKKRDEKQLERFVIASEYVGSKKKPRLEREIRILPVTDGRFAHDVIEFIYGGKVAFINLNSETALVIEDMAMAEFHKQIFRSLYKRL